MDKDAIQPIPIDLGYFEKNYVLVRVGIPVVGEMYICDNQICHCSENHGHDYPLLIVRLK